MYAIAIGNAFDGINIYLDEKGFPFNSHDEAVDVAERKFEDWVIIELNTIANLEESNASSNSSQSSS
jgi:hypothetical protein